MFSCEYMKDLKTGDLILCNYTKKGGLMSFFSGLIKSCTKSSYSHIGMILKDPSFLHPTLKGLYVWESTWEGKADPQDGKIKLGVQITPLYELVNSYKSKGHISVRRVNCSPDLFSDVNLTKIHNIVYDKPYDIVPLDWLEALSKVDPNPQKTDRFWCSALVGYIYTKCRLLEVKTDWSILAPADFSLMSKKLNFISRASLANIEEKLI